MCRTVGCYAPSTKYAMAASLINWRSGCLRRGQDCYRRAKEATRNDPVRQLAQEVLIIIGDSQMESSMFSALLMSAIAFLIPVAQIVLFKALLRSGIKN
ncbi:hypothetical protein [Chlorogloea sp. CCALA 695]|uniref:hypothetical protein n=1 Tax=Chlorogloea sp. CCALA 695 TaxID=2107693 RepID=UPI000D065E69|nr:hypothetical protein [Chlorogloea sp. CCALA 695]PSB28367.1 hypothetical protein C7B70_21160 [Chlorogloea sp. CCALA 695]